MIQSNGYGRFGLTDDQRKLEIAKGVIARLKDSIVELRSENKHLLATSNKRQDTIDEMIEEFCCRPLVDRIMEDANTDCEVALLEARDAKEEARISKEDALMVGRVCLRQEKVVSHTGYSFAVNSGLSEFYDEADVGDEYNLNILVPTPEKLTQEDRRLLGITQGSQEDEYYAGLRRNTITEILAGIKNWAEDGCSVGRPTLCGNPTCRFFHILVRKLQ